MDNEADRRANADIVVRNTRPEDFAGIETLSRIVYPADFPWTSDYLTAHRSVFPEGQFVAVDQGSGELLGMSAGLLVVWEDYADIDTYLDFTDEGYFWNHDPSGRTFYGAEVMVDPEKRGRGVGTALYAARKDLVRTLGLRRIRAHARLSGYHRHADRQSAEAYVRRVVAGEIVDPTLTFQLRHGFRVLGVVTDYFARDPRSRGCAALIEWVCDPE